MFVSGRCRLLLPLMSCAAFTMLSGHAELSGGSLQGSGGGLRGSGGSLQGSSGLNHKADGLQGGKLRSSRVQGSRLQTGSTRGAKIQGAKRASEPRRLEPATLKRKASELARTGLGLQALQGAASTIPRSQVGALLYDVAGELKNQHHPELDMRPTIVGYYMAVLADPEGERQRDAMIRLKEIFMDQDLEHEEAIRLYQGGIETMNELVDSKIGLTPEGRRSALGSLGEVQAAYRHSRPEKPAEEVSEMPEGSEPAEEPANEAEP